MMPGPDSADIISGHARGAELSLPDTYPGLWDTSPRRHPSGERREGTGSPGVKGCLESLPPWAGIKAPACVRCVTEGKLLHPLQHRWKW